MSEISDPQDWHWLDDMVEVAREHPNTEIVLRDKTNSFSLVVVFDTIRIIYTNEGVRIPEADARRIVSFVKGNRNAIL